MADTLDLVTLTEAREFLNIDSDDTVDDTEIQGFITAITPVVEAEIGPVVERTETAIIYDSGCYNAIPAPRWPISSLTSGSYLDSSGSVDITNMIADSGLLVTTNGAAFPAKAWTLTYVPGRAANTAAVPLGIKKGALEVLSLAWGSQRVPGQAPAFLISYRAAAWFKPYKSGSVGFA